MNRESNKGPLPDFWDHERKLIQRAQENGVTIAEIKRFIETGKRSEKKGERADDAEAMD